MDSTSLPFPTRSVESCLASVETNLREIIRAGKFDLDLTVRRVTNEPAGTGAPGVIVDLSGRDADLLLEKNGAVLDALEYVVVKAARLDEELFTRVVFDCKDWRRLREEELKTIARMAAERVLESGDSFEMNPMTPRERRIVHLVLRDDTRIRTVSEGRGPNRRVVIHLSTPPAPRA